MKKIKTEKRYHCKVKFTRWLRRSCAVLLVLCLIPVAGVSAVMPDGSQDADVDDIPQSGISVNCPSAILMEASTGTVLYEKEADKALPPASVTKVMTLLLVMEAVRDGKLSLTDTVRASANAASMGGSQIFLKENEEMTAEDMIKSVVIASANDAAVALAEHIAGTEEAFVMQMNKRAAELGMKNTCFENTNGLDDTVEKHLTSARDIAIMSRELIKHKKILEFSSTWMDSIRDGKFGLTNTNRLVRFYKGATGLKTGSTSKAGFCISATAQRNGMTLICVIMGAETRDIRNAAAVSLLDYGFGNFGIYRSEGGKTEPIAVKHGRVSFVEAECRPFSCVLPKNYTDKVEAVRDIPTELCAPITEGQKVGSVIYKLGDREIGRSDAVALTSAEKMTYGAMISDMLRRCTEIF